ncbi:uncharacterized protein BJ171DRAFT_499931 [Polychytrium aggregatum]|uniref:uncharacterized protein n=1 Tax=Polychytrium aggregatum TaxID=110093 RepID=UPI0022FF43F0|nr:uncharacterized protein BJ171DRAFT_499931 [Polychytrium aggregatum]KAI9205866.1 hypothetical protein BJ171DRAFT_499931 [Polychytrium aggregatum]
MSSVSAVSLHPCAAPATEKDAPSTVSEDERAPCPMAANKAKKPSPLNRSWLRASGFFWRKPKDAVAPASSATPAKPLSSKTKRSSVPPSNGRASEVSLTSGLKSDLAATIEALVAQAIPGYGFHSFLRKCRSNHAQIVAGEYIEQICRTKECISYVLDVSRYFIRVQAEAQHGRLVVTFDAPANDRPMPHDNPALLGLGISEMPTGPSDISTQYMELESRMAELGFRLDDVSTESRLHKLSKWLAWDSSSPENEWLRYLCVDDNEHRGMPSHAMVDYITSLLDLESYQAELANLKGYHRDSLFKLASRVSLLLTSKDVNEHMARSILKRIAILLLQTRREFTLPMILRFDTASLQSKFTVVKLGDGFVFLGEN